LAISRSESIKYAMFRPVTNQVSFSAAIFEKGIGSSSLSISSAVDRPLFEFREDARKAAESTVVQSVLDEQAGRA
jgi:hypothetical protein